MSLASLLLLFSVPAVLMLLVVFHIVRSLCHGHDTLPDRHGYAWRYPGAVRGGVVYCHRCHCSRLQSRRNHCGQLVYACSLCGTALFIS